MSKLENPYAASIRTAWLVGGGCTAWFLIGMTLLRHHLFWYFWALPLGLIGLLTAPFTMWMTKGAGRQVEEMEKSPIAKWTYSDSERRDFAQADYRVQRWKAFKTGLQTVGIGFLIGAFVLWLNGDYSSWKVPFFLVAFPLAIGSLAWLAKWSVAVWMCRVRMNGSGEVVIGYNGIIENGKLTSWRSPWVGLKDVQLEPGTPPVLRFALSQSRGEDWEMRVLVPAGRDADAHKVVKDLGRTPEPTRHAKKKHLS